MNGSKRPARERKMHVCQSCSTLFRERNSYSTANRNNAYCSAKCRRSAERFRDPEKMKLAVSGGRGKTIFTLISPEDYERALERYWYLNRFGYVMSTRTRDYPSIGLHRFLLGEPSDKWVDHISGDKLDNRRENLRLCDRQGNARNRFKNLKPASSIYKGVTWNARKGKWYALIFVEGKQRFIGQFDDEVEAALAYDARARLAFGEFAKLNFP